MSQRGSDGVRPPAAGSPPSAGAGSQAGARPRLTLWRICDPDPATLERLEALDLEAFGPAGLRTYDIAVMAQAGAVFAAQAGDEVVGGCQLMRVLDEPGFFYIVGFYIRPAWRGRGFGRELLRLVADESRSLGGEGLILTVAPENLAAMALYKSFGFLEDRFVPRFYGENEDRHILRWRFPMGR